MPFQLICNPTGLAHSRYKTIRDSIKDGDTLHLERDPNNSFDQFAIKVNNLDGVQIGWIPRGQNQELAGLMDQGVGVAAHVLTHEPNLNIYTCLTIKIEETDVKHDPDGLEPEGDDLEILE